MKLSELLSMESVAPWSGDAKIPWHDPTCSARMLREHLSQRHDRASRKLETIDRHVSWIHEVSGGNERALRILDLGCGPGFYTARFAALGHSCVGIDFSPASIEFARAEATEKGLRCEYQLKDMRGADFGSDFDLALVRRLGSAGNSWYVAREDVFSDEPHLCLKACADDAYASMLARAGFADVVRYPSLTGSVAEEDDGLLVFVAQRR